jgi:hypothetical protein
MCSSPSALRTTVKSKPSTVMLLNAASLLQNASHSGSSTTRRAWHVGLARLSGDDYVGQHHPRESGLNFAYLGALSQHAGDAQLDDAGDGERPVPRSPLRSRAG